MAYQVDIKGFEGLIIGHRLCRIVYACELQNDINIEITFPKLLLCSHSMHSKHKLRDNYPDIDGNVLLSVMNHDFI